MAGAIKVGDAVRVVGPAIGVALNTAGTIVSIDGDFAKLRVSSRYCSGVVQVPLASLATSHALEERS